MRVLKSAKLCYKTKLSTARRKVRTCLWVDIYFGHDVGRFITKFVKNHFLLFLGLNDIYI
jgi:hypothetical protein